MKKILSLILALVLCFGLCACGDTSGDATNDKGNNDSGKLDFLYQEWRRTEDGLRLSFINDNTCILFGNECKYEYNEELGIISIYSSRTNNLNVVKEGDTYKLTTSNSTFVSAEQFRNEYVDEAISNAAFGAQEILPGNTYTTESGLTFTFEKAELIEDGTNYLFSIYFVCDNEMAIRDAWYVSPSETDGYPCFSFGVKEQSTDKNSINFVSEREISQDEIKEDIKDYGILVLSIGTSADNQDSEYYITLDTFLN